MSPVDQLRLLKIRKFISLYIWDTTEKTIWAALSTNFEIRTIEKLVEHPISNRVAERPRGSVVVFLNEWRF